MDTVINEDVLVSMDVKAELKILPAVLKMIRIITHNYHLDRDSARELELAVEEACHNVIEHAYRPDEGGRYQVEVIKDATKFAVKVKDQGMPFNLELLDEKEPSDIGVKLMKAFADEVDSKYLGKNGKEVILIKYLPFKPLKPSEKDSKISEKADLAPSSEKIDIRLMRPNETVSLARCIYRVYGYTYPHEDIYYPQKFASLIKSGMVHSYVAVNPAGEVIGHLGVFLDAPNDPVGESALAVVDPRYRGRGIFPKMKKTLMHHMAQKGLKGLYSRAVTVHTASQKSNVKMGAKETGFILAHSPPTTIFKKMETEEGGYRRTVALFYVPVVPDQEQTVTLPIKYDKILKKIYSHAELQRRYDNIIKPEFSSYSHIHSRLLPEMGSAFLRVNRYSVDFLEELRIQVKQLCLKSVELIVLDLPLRDPTTAYLIPKINEIGFFFDGLMPEYLNGDAIRMQYLNNVAFDPSNVDVYSDFGKEIFSYVVNEWRTISK